MEKVKELIVIGACFAVASCVLSYVLTNLPPKECVELGPCFTAPEFVFFVFMAVSVLGAIAFFVAAIISFSDIE